MAPVLLGGASPTQLRVLSGALLDLAAPDWELISLADIAHALSVLPRWNGMRRRQISVLEHSLSVWQAAPQGLKLEALLHDAHEAYTGDITRPMQLAIAWLAPDGARAIKRIQHRLDVAIARRVLFDGAPPWTVVELEAEILAESMRDGPLLAVDDQVLRAEFGDDELENAKKPDGYRNFIVDFWLAAVPEECRKRYGAAESAEPRQTQEESP